MIYAIILGLAIIVGSVFQQFWIGTGTGLVISLIFFLSGKYREIIKKRRAEEKKKDPPKKSEGATPAEGKAGTGDQKPGRVKGLIFWVAIISGAGWLGYSFYYQEGWPGSAYYEKRFDLVLTDLEQEVCVPGLRTGKWYFHLPKQAWYATPRFQPGGYKGRLMEFFVQYPDGKSQIVTWFDNVRVNGTPLGTREKIEVGSGGCFRATLVNLKGLNGKVVGTTCLHDNPNTCDVPLERIPATTGAVVSGKFFFD